MTEPGMTPMLIFIAVICVATLLLLPLVPGFLRELRYLNSEVQRNVGAERRYWVRRRRRLWLSLLPFIKY